jgi:hypothetical protein
VDFFKETAMEKLTLSTNLVNGILQYLGNQPYAAVANLIQGIQQEAQGQIAPPAEEAPAAE